MNTYRNFVIALALCFCAAMPAFATTKGLNQIVTPDVQPKGLLSLSLQIQDRAIGDTTEIQAELGLTRHFEVALFQGLDPGQFYFNAEYGLIQKGDWLLSTGFMNWTTRGNKPQVYLEGGWYHRRQHWIAGLSQVEHETQGIFGFGYQLNPKLALQFDWQTGQNNSLTAGFTYNFTPTLSLNPSIYMTNSKPHNLYGYAVLSYSFNAF